jgi:peptidoglycan/LPS O-acetylase OafA/YrhL
MLPVIEPVRSTWIIAACLAAGVLASMRRGGRVRPFPPAVTEELKGLAILTVVFGHLGYFVSADHRFLWPFSVASGVGVDIFLFLSGYGITLSTGRRPLGPGPFYRRRLPRLYVPLWLTLAALFVADRWFLQRAYAARYIALAFLGAFPTADIVRDVDSPLWFFTLIVGYYLVFPWVFDRRRVWLSAAAAAAVGAVSLVVHPGGAWPTVWFYQLHFAAFPLGMLAASRGGAAAAALRRLAGAAGRDAASRLRYTAVLAGLGALACYLAINSDVGASPLEAQAISLATALAVVAFFVVNNAEIGLLGVFGICSYEIYLVHVPLVTRYAVAFRLLPGWAATVVSLAAVLGLGWLLQRTSGALLSAARTTSEPPAERGTGRRAA